MSVQGTEARILDVLRRSPLFSALDPRILQDVAGSFRLLPVTASASAGYED